MTTIAAPVVVAEMADWVALGGGNSGIVGNKLHTYGFHLGAEDVSPTDYSRTHDPNGWDGPFVDSRYACAGDFAHRNDETLRAMHRNLLARLMRGELPMICEFIGKPWADRPVYYWARWNGVGTLQRYNGSGHDIWSHVSWFRSMVNQRAFLWVAGPPQPSGGDVPLYGKLHSNATVWCGSGAASRTVSFLGSVVGGEAAIRSFATSAELFDYVGPPLDQTIRTIVAQELAKDTQEVELSEESIEEIAARTEAAAAAGAAAGAPSAKEIATAVVDEEADRLQN